MIFDYFLAPFVHGQVEDLFSKYGRIVEIDLKLPPRPPGFAFVEFAHSRDAQDAVDGRDGYDFYGSRLRVRRSPLACAWSMYGIVSGAQVDDRATAAS